MWISFLLMLEQITTNLMVENNASSPHSSVSQKFSMALSRVKSRYQQAAFFSGHCRRESISLAFLAFLGPPTFLGSWSLVAAAAAKLLQSCLTLYDPIDRSPPGSPIPWIFQARTLEWVAISFSNVWKWKVKGKSLSHVWLLATSWTAAYQAPPSMGFSRQEYWSGVPLRTIRLLEFMAMHRMCTFPSSVWLLVCSLGIGRQQDINYWKSLGQQRDQISQS